jgi:translation initiation factor IF-1
MIIGRICIRIKSNDIIKILMGQFDLIMGQIEF